VLPMPVTAPLVELAAGAVTGQAATVKIAHWHGLESPALWMSIFAFGMGTLLLASYAPIRALWDGAWRPDGQRLFDALLAALQVLARAMVARWHDGALSRYMALAFGTVLGLGIYAVSGGAELAFTRPATPLPLGVAAGAVVFLVALAVAVLRHADRVLALLLVGVLGLMISAAFAYLSAPDLALTQIAVEVVTVILMLLALNFLPKTTPAEAGWRGTWGAGLLAALVGGATAALAYGVMRGTAGFAPISAFHLAQSKPGAGGTNAVNTVIVDFRGYDTYGEIIVLGIAALIIAALVEGLLSVPAVRARLDPIFPMQERAGDRHPMMLVVATRFLLPIGMLVGVYIYLRGHNLPGGGFVAGLVFAIAMLLQYIASGYGWSIARQRINAHSLIGAGVLVASATGIGSWLAGRPFLTSSYGYIHLWPLEEFEWATAAAFDLGVFLCVFGAVMLALANLARLAQAGGEAASKTPFDMALPRKGQR